MINILICNRGLSALKFIISLKDWLINDLDACNQYQFKLFGFVSNVDLQTQYKYIGLLDQQIYVADNNNIYMDITKIIDYCKEYNINMVFPGWGYLSENNNFVEELEINNIIFIGPTSKSMKLIGNKISCSNIAEKIGCNVLAWSGDKQLKTYDEIVYWCNKITYPVMLKAANSGGGKGIRIIRKETEIYEMWQEIINEIKTNTDTNPMIYATKYIEKASHFEIQIIGDGDKCIHLHGRDCTTQRRNQKLVEECPITKVNQDIINNMQNNAIKLLTYVQYRCLGTVEFIYDQLDKQIYILEVNPRIQVEHIITEQLFNINLIKIQMLLALGKKIHEINDLAYLNYNFKKHIISIRINAENPYEDFRPSLGKITYIDTNYNKNTWGYFSMENGGEISNLVDSQFGHMLAIGKDRFASIRKLTNLLNLTKIKANIYNTISFLKNYINTNDFKQNNHSTRYLHDVKITDLTNKTILDEIVIFLSMIYIAYINNIQKELTCYDSVKRGHSYLLKQYNCLSYGLVIYSNTKYEYKYLFKINIDNQKDTENKELIILYNGSYYHIKFKIFNKIIYLFIKNKIYTISHNYLDDNYIEIIINEHNYMILYNQKNSNIKSPISGKIIECIYSNQTYINQSDPYIKIECMKMIMTLKAETNGIITYIKNKNDYVELNEIIAIITPKSTIPIQIPNISKDILTINKFIEFNEYISTESVYNLIVKNNYELFKSN